VWMREAVLPGFGAECAGKIHDHPDDGTMVVWAHDAWNDQFALCAEPGRKCDRSETARSVGVPEGLGGLF